MNDVRQVGNEPNPALGVTGGGGDRRLPAALSVHDSLGLDVASLVRAGVDIPAIPFQKATGLKKPWDVNRYQVDPLLFHVMLRGLVSAAISPTRTAFARLLNDSSYPISGRIVSNLGLTSSPGPSAPPGAL